MERKMEATLPVKQEEETDDVKKSNVAKRKEREDAHDEYERAWKFLSKNPDKLTLEMFSPLRNLMSDAVHNPGKYPLAPPSAFLDFEASTGSLNDSSLSPGVARALLDRKMDSENGFSPVLKIAFVGQQRQSVGKGCYIERYTMHAIDGDGMFMTLKVSTGMNATMDGVKNGDVVRLLHYTPVYYSFDDFKDTRALLLVLNFAMVGQSTSLESSQPRPPHGFDVASVVSDMNATTPVVQPPVDPIVKQEDDKEDPPPPGYERQPKKKPTCHGNLCALYGICFVQCVTVCTPVSRLSLEEVARNYPWTDREVSQMTLSQKRAMLFHWYATNIYSITGVDHREDMPPCLKWDIRDAYPEPSGLYKIFVRKSPSKMNKRRR